VHENVIVPTPHFPTSGVRRVLRKLGGDIRDARRLRRLPMAVVAERAFTSRSTLERVEQGDPAVGIGIYAGVLQALGLLDSLGDLADPSQDGVGQALAAVDLPQHARLRQARAPRPAGESS